MKKIFLAVCVLFTAIVTDAQINTNLIVAAQPPAQLSEWGNRKEVLTYVVAGNAAGQQFTVKIKAEIKLTDGTVVGATNLNTATTYTLPQQTIAYYANDVLPLNNMVFTGKYKSSLERTGKLPADNYMLCVRLVRIPDYTPVSEEKCKTFYLASLQLPILMMPADEQQLDAKQAQTAIMFRWTPLVPKPTTPVKYRLQIFEVLPQQQPMQALRANMPVLDKEIINATQFIWQPQLAYNNSLYALDSITNISAGANASGNAFALDSISNISAGNNNTPKKGNKGIAANTPVAKFIWTIRTTDSQGNPVTQTDGNGEARSEPKWFVIVKKN
jgi:hypothetical protein